MRTGGRLQGLTHSIYVVNRFPPRYGRPAETNNSVRISTISDRKGTPLVDDARRYDRSSAGARYLSIVERGSLERGSSQLADPAERPAGFHFSSASLERPPKLVVG